MPPLALLPDVLLNSPGFVHPLVRIGYDMEPVQYDPGFGKKPLHNLPVAGLHVYANFLHTIRRYLLQKIFQRG